MNNTQAIFLFIVIVVVLLVIRYAVSYLFNKGGDAVDNAIRKKQAEKYSSGSENLADRFQNTDSNTDGKK